jgi:hypothetical protein
MFFKLYKYKVILILIVLFAPLWALAYETEWYDDKKEDRMVVTPSKLQLNLQSGQVVKKEILIINRLGREEEFFVQVEGLINEEELKNLDKKYFPKSGVGWIKPEIDSIRLKHGERVKFDVEITVPENVKSSGYYAALNILVRNKKGEDDQINLESRIGIPLLISVPGSVQKKGEITKFSVDKWFYLNGPVVFFTDFRNLGNIHLMPRGEISVYNFLGAKVAQIPLKDSTVLPGFTQSWKSAWDKKWLLGKYRAELLMFFGEGQEESLRKNVTFYAFPLHLLLLLIIVVVLIYFLIRKIHSKFEIRRK